METRWRNPHGLTRFEAAVLLAAAGILGYQLFLPPVVGLADNGDFDRVMHPAGLSHRTDDPSERYFRHLALRYRAGPPATSGYRSSEIPIAAAARFYTTGLAPRGHFDIRYLGVLHALLFLGALALLLVGSRGWRSSSRIAFAASLLFLFTDVGYVASLLFLYRSIARFYLRHPGRLAARFERGAERSTQLRSWQLGNFADESGARPFRKSRAFALWSGWKARLAPLAPWLLRSSGSGISPAPCWSGVGRIIPGSGACPCSWRSWR